MAKSVHRGRISALVLRAASVAVGLGIFAAQLAGAQTLTVLYNFTGGTDGSSPSGRLSRDAAGNLYGTTFDGGDPDCACGVVFKVDTSGTESVLHSFTGNRKDGELPYGGLVRDEAGDLYGTTARGGGYGWGTVFEVDIAGKETVLHNFAGGTKDGNDPYGGLVRDQKGNLYGDTEEGGGKGCYLGCGTVFKLEPAGKETVLHRFHGTDGANPVRALVRDKKGNLYGVTNSGGTGCGDYGCGVVYELSPSGELTVLHAFAGGTTDGCEALGSPAMDANGNLYGTATGCGSSGLGIVWEISNNGTETVLHNFAGGATDGAHPQSNVIMDANGDLYGTTGQGGAFDDGTVYELNKSGVVILLHSFDGFDGKSPIAGLTPDKLGNFYSTTYAGGNLEDCDGSGCGTVWKLTP